MIINKVTAIYDLKKIMYLKAYAEKLDERNYNLDNRISIIVIALTAWPKLVRAICLRRKFDKVSIATSANN